MNGHCSHETTVDVEIVSGGASELMARFGPKDLYGGTSATLIAQACADCGLVSLQLKHPMLLRNYVEEQKEKEVKRT